MIVHAKRTQVAPIRAPASIDHACNRCAAGENDHVLLSLLDYHTKSPSPCQGENRISFSLFFPGAGVCIFLLRRPLQGAGIRAAGRPRGAGGPPGPPPGGPPPPGPRPPPPPPRGGGGGGGLGAGGGGAGGGRPPPPASAGPAARTFPPSPCGYSATFTACPRWKEYSTASVTGRPSCRRTIAAYSRSCRA